MRGEVVVSVSLRGSLLVCSLLAVSPLLSFARTARAEAPEPEAREPQTLELEWSAPAGCPQAGSVKAEVLRLAQVDRRLTPELRARGRLRNRGPIWELDLATEFGGSTGERSLSAGSCRALTNAATLMLALILNPDVEPPEPDPPPAVEQPTKLGVALSGRAGAELGVLRALGPSVALGAGLSLGSASVWSYAGLSPPHDARVRGSSSSGPGGRVWAGSAALFGCWDITKQTPFGPCAGIQLTRVEGTGISVRNPDTAVAYWASGLAGVRAGLRLGDVVTLRIEGFAAIPAQRPSLFLEGLGRVVRPERLGGKLHAGADFELR